MPRLAAAVAAVTQPVVLVVDQVELLDNPECVDAVVELAVRLPAGSQLALAARVQPRLPVALVAGQGRVVKLGVDELAMDQQEARALLAGAGVQLDEAATGELLRRTEGWPVGAWCQANGLPEAAIDHAQAAGDADRVAGLVAGLVASLGQATFASGRVDTIRRWVGWFDGQGLIARYPLVAVQGALLHLLLGEPAAAERWADAAERGAAAAGTGQEPSMVAAMPALLRAFLCRNGVEQMRTDAQTTLAGLAPGSPWRAPGLLVEGTAWLLAGQAGRADPILAHTVEVATHAGALPARLRPLLTHAIPWLAVQALLELVRAYLAIDDLAGARVVLREANDVLRRRPDLGTLPQQAAQLRSRVDTIGGGTMGASSLSKAELRLLPLLPTYLSHREIGERLYLSQHTVKSQALSIDRKLGVSSRSEAIARARGLGLLES